MITSQRDADRPSNVPTAWLSTAELGTSLEAAARQKQALLGDVQPAQESPRQLADARSAAKAEVVATQSRVNEAEAELAAQA